MDIKEDLKNIIDKIDYGQVAKLAMLERGAYAVSGPQESASDAVLFEDFASKYLTAKEDLTVVNRQDPESALQQEDFKALLAQMKAPQHIIFVECLELGTTEIKGFLNTLLSSDLIKSSKVILLDLPQLEYMALRSSMKGKIAI
ncbi:hypothetical protein [Lactococcus formosensis]|jgi:hypothetical protein|uniref:Uncharacterized protein n=1 Tax=Lactococcus formosensis TaxID=1281486 RepID=A0A9Q8Y1K4_9LACT|nr:hypothetical protein [Lactococcus formosensis]MCH1724062.1 hypothetical protein [Lactococcus formosensis]MDG6112296.1 hypothetical protein [Lactococcus formosensis]MDG6114597.1 hypothetical protein [Lactococcus formosensis]MDG6116728.1 hypothetical protein [Lactococcus formosensis]MDG6118501.1 hypothetical protein [Lactococcus formosensis]